MEKFLEHIGDFIINEDHSKNNEKRQINLINLIGFQEDVAGGKEDLEEIRSILHLCNINTNVIPDSLERLKYAKHAALNVVFGYGIKLAQKMEREWGIPYVVIDYPYGVEGLKSFIETIHRHSGFNFDISQRIFDEIYDRLKRYRDYLPLFYEASACVVGDLPRISGLSRFLEEELGMNVELAFETSSAIEKFGVPCSKFVETYEAFADEMNNSDPKALFGTDEERRIRSDTIVLAFPSFTRMSFVPYMGRGTLNLISDIYERIIRDVWIK